MSSLGVSLLKVAHFFLQNFWFKYYNHRVPLPKFLSFLRPIVRPLDVLLGAIGLIPLIVHRALLENIALKPAPVDPIPDGKEKPTCPLKFRPSDGFGADIDNPMTSVTMTAPGRNMDILPKEKRTHRSGGPDVQLVAQRLLARESFKPAGDQLNILAASWIQAMVHDWIGHVDGDETHLDKGEESMCPMKKFKFFDTKERPDGHYNTERTMWWDASFLYGQTEKQVQNSRTGKGGKLKVNETHPMTLAQNPDGTDTVGDGRNSWVGVSILQELFLREHNYIADKIAEENRGLSDDELFGYARNCIAALVAKIHTIDWTVELLKTVQLEIAMEANWMGFTKAIFGKNAPFEPFRLTKKEKADNNGVPFVLTEEFAAVYRLHPLSPPGLVIEEDGEAKSFVGLMDLLTGKGRDIMRSSPDMPKKLFQSVLNYPCGNLVGANYPDAYREMSPTDVNGLNKPTELNVDLAALDLYRDRERGILGFNEFRRQIGLKPFKSWVELVGRENRHLAPRLEKIYGPAPEGIEKCDLLVGDLYEKKIPGFALSETSFIIFLLMASRRLDSDPYLNELWTEEYYTPFGMKHVYETDNLLALVKRHYPDLAEPFEEKGQSVFKPLYGPDKWKEAEEKKIIPEEITNRWAENKRKNDEYFANA